MVSSFLLRHLYESLFYTELMRYFSLNPGAFLSLFQSFRHRPLPPHHAARQTVLGIEGRAANGDDPARECELTIYHLQSHRLSGLHHCLQ